MELSIKHCTKCLPIYNHYNTKSLPTLSYCTLYRNAIRQTCYILIIDFSLTHADINGDTCSNHIRYVPCVSGDSRIFTVTVVRRRT